MFKDNSHNNPGGFRKRRDRREGGANYGKKPEFDQQVLDIARVTRVTKGGKRFSFRASVVIGDGKNSVGLGVAKGRDVSQSIQKAVHQARKHMVKISVKEHTIPHQVKAKFKSAEVILKPAAVGNGVKAGGPVRAVAKLAGIENVTAKLISRTKNKINIAKAAIRALQQLTI